MALIWRPHERDDGARYVVDAISVCSVVGTHRDEGHEIDGWRSAYAHMQRLEKLVTIEVRRPALRIAEDRVGRR